MVSTRIINDVKVRPIKLPQIKTQQIRGYDMFPEIYSNVFLCAKKKSGKTSVIYNIIKKCVDKNTQVIIFCSTCLKDKNWIEIRKYLERKNITHDFYQSLKEDGIDRLSELVENLQYEVSSSEEESEEEEEPPEIIKLDDGSFKFKSKKRKPKMISQKYLLIFDDLSTEIRNPQVSSLLKKNRHFKMKILLSSQYLNDLEPQARRQIDVYLLWGGLNEQKLKELYANADLDISYEQYLDLYKNATQEKFNFFYIDTNGSYRKNFQIEYII